MPVINVEEMTELESHHFVTPNVKSNSGKNHQCMLKPITYAKGEMFRNRKLTCCQTITAQITQQCKGENVSLK